MLRPAVGVAGYFADDSAQHFCHLMTTVRRFWIQILVLIVSSLVVTATVHAQEQPEALTIDCSGAQHGYGDADQSQGDSDKAIPHHHGSCHGPSLYVPANDSLSVAAFPSDIRPMRSSDRATPSRLVDPALRPPAA